MVVHPQMGTNSDRLLNWQMIAGRCSIESRSRIKDCCEGMISSRSHPQCLGGFSMAVES
jgi:hypothetical protein